VTGRPRLAVTLGDPRGIGPEIVARTLRDARATSAGDLVLGGSSGVEVGGQEQVGSWRSGDYPSCAGQLAGR